MASNATSADRHPRDAGDLARDRPQHGDPVRGAGDPHRALRRGRRHGDRDVLALTSDLTPQSLGTAPVSGDTATLVKANLPVGAYDIYATYGGDSLYLPSNREQHGRRSRSPPIRRSRRAASPSSTRGSTRRTTATATPTRSAARPSSPRRSRSASTRAVERASRRSRWARRTAPTRRPGRGAGATARCSRRAPTRSSSRSRTAAATRRPSTSRSRCRPRSSTGTRPRRAATPTRARSRTTVTAGRSTPTPGRTASSSSAARAATQRRRYTFTLPSATIYSSVRPAVYGKSMSGYGKGYIGDPQLRHGRSRCPQVRRLLDGLVQQQRRGLGPRDERPQGPAVGVRRERQRSAASTTSR